MRVHQHLGRFPAFFGEPAVFRYTLHDAIPKASKEYKHPDLLTRADRGLPAAFAHLAWGGVFMVPGPLTYAQTFWQLIACRNIGRRRVVPAERCRLTEMNEKLPAPCEACRRSRLRHGACRPSAKEKAIAYLSTGGRPRCNSKGRSDGTVPAECRIRHSRCRSGRFPPPWSIEKTSAFASIRRRGCIKLLILHELALPSSPFDEVQEFKRRVKPRAVVFAGMMAAWTLVLRSWL